MLKTRCIQCEKRHWVCYFRVTTSAWSVPSSSRRRNSATLRSGYLPDRPAFFFSPVRLHAHFSLDLYYRVRWNFLLVMRYLASRGPSSSFVDLSLALSCWFFSCLSLGLVSQCFSCMLKRHAGADQGAFGQKRFISCLNCGGVSNHYPDSRAQEQTQTHAENHGGHGSKWRQGPDYFEGPVTCGDADDD